MESTRLVACLVLATTCAVDAGMLVLKADSATATTGGLLDGTRNLGITTNVVEIAGLAISARSGDVAQKINVTLNSLGINTDGTNDVTDAFEAGEQMVLSFDRDIRISRFDFRGFDSNETFTVAVEGLAVFEIAYGNLSNKSTDVFDTNLVVEANREIAFYTTGSGLVGLDGIDLSVLVEASAGPSLSLLQTNGMASVGAEFGEAPGTNYVLQYIGSLTESNGWQTVSPPFSSSTNWMLETTNDAGFYRVVPEQGVLP